MDKTKTNYPDVSVIIVSLNGRKWLKGLLSTLLESDYPSDKLELIFVDNGSSDSSIEFVKEFVGDKLNLRILKNSFNIGWSPANNQGMLMANGEIILCLSNDMEIDPACIKEITKLMANDKSVGIVQCNSLSMWDRKTPDSGMNYLDKLGFAYSYAPLNRAVEVFYAEGMAFAVRHEVLAKIGVLDNYFFMEYDDMDYSWRARLVGYRVFFIPTAKVYHARGGTVGTTYFQRINNVRWYTRNHLVTLIKNYESRNLMEILPFVMAIETTKILYLLTIKKNWKLANSASKGIFDVLRDFGLILQKRIEVQKLRTISDKEIIRSMHPFNPWLQRRFLVMQAMGKRFAITTKLPIAEVRNNEKN